MSGPDGRNAPTRRAVLAGAGALGAMALGGAALAPQLTDAAHLRRVLDRLVGPFQMAHGDWQAFVAAFRAGEDDLDTLKAVPLRALEGLGLLDDAAAAAPDALRERVATFERRLLTDFVMTTDLAARGGDAPVRFHGPLACGNPFADTSPPDAA